MNKNNKVILVIIGIIIALIAIFSAMTIYRVANQEKGSEKVETKISEVILDECTDEYEEMEEEIIKTNAQQDKLSPNCQIILTKYYNQCKDEINEYIEIPKSLINGTKEDLQNQYKDWEIKEFSSNQVVLFKQFDGECGEHYILRDNDGKIFIYKINEKGKEELYEKTEISTEYLPEGDKNSINTGLKVNGREKLNELIESFE